MKCMHSALPVCLLGVWTKQMAGVCLRGVAECLHGVWPNYDLWVWERERGWAARLIDWYQILKELEWHSKILLYDGKSL